MKDDTKLLTKLKNIEAVYLDSASTPGEKQAAKSMLDRLMEKYGVTFEEIRETVKEPLNIHVFSYSNPYEKKLMFQVLFKVTSTSSLSFWSSSPYSRSNKNSKNSIWIEITETQNSRAVNLYEFYRKELHKELENMTTAFIAKNRINGPASESPSGESLSVEEMEEIKKIVKLSQGLERLPDIDVPALNSTN